MEALQIEDLLFKFRFETMETEKNIVVLYYIFGDCKSSI